MCYPKSGHADFTGVSSLWLLTTPSCIKVNAVLPPELYSKCINISLLKQNYNDSNKVFFSLDTLEAGHGIPSLLS